MKRIIVFVFILMITASIPYLAQSQAKKNPALFLKGNFIGTDNKGVPVYHLYYDKNIQTFDSYIYIAIKLKLTPYGKANNPIKVGTTFIDINQIVILYSINPKMDSIRAVYYLYNRDKKKKKVYYYNRIRIWEIPEPNSVESYTLNLTKKLAKL
jgi:hypothetical protein